MRCRAFAVLCFFVCPFSSFAEVTSVTIASRTIVAAGEAFGSTGSYEKLVGQIEFALDPADVHNAGIDDLTYAPRDAEGRVRFASNLCVLRPGDPTKGNGVLLFEIANRRHVGLLNYFNRGTVTDDPTSAVDFGDGLLMREGYTVVWIGWEFDAPAPAFRLEMPPSIIPATVRIDPLSVDMIVNAPTDEAFLIDEPVRPPVVYPPAAADDPADRLTVRDHFWDDGLTIPRERWRFVAGPNSLPKVKLDGGFEPGRYYRVTYHATAPVAAGEQPDPGRCEGAPVSGASRRCRSTPHRRPGAADWRPADAAAGTGWEAAESRLPPMPFLVPQVDRDGNEVAGVLDPEAAVPLATTTGWNFRNEAVGNPGELYQTLGSYIPFAVTRLQREATGDPRLSIEERYRGIDDYLRRIRASAITLIQHRYMLQEDLDGVMTRARAHWIFATRDRSSAPAGR